MPQPKVFIRKGYAMIETGNGTARLIDPVSDGPLLAELEVRLPEESMAKLREAIFQLPEGTEATPMTPKELLTSRLFVKNFASSGKRAQAYIRALPGEWKVRQIGDDDWDFAVSRDGRKWHLFDPGLRQSALDTFQAPVIPLSGLGGLGPEVVMDLLDLTTDAIIGTASGAAFVGGLALGAPAGPGGALALGSAAAGGATTGLEGIKQAIGQAAGIPDNVDIPDAVAIGVITSVFSAAGPAAGKTIKKVGGVIKKIAKGRLGQSIREATLEAGAGLAGIRGAGPTLRPERVLEARIADKAGIFQEIPGVGKTGAALRRLVQMSGRKQIPEQAIADQMQKEATEAGVTINVNQLIDDILDPLTPETTVIRSGELQRGAKTVEEVAKSKGLKTRSLRTTETVRKEAGDFQRALETLEETTTEGGVSRRVAETTETVSRQGAGKVTRPKTREGALSKLRTEENVSGRVQGLIDDINAFLAADGSSPDAVPVTTAVQVKSAIQAIADERKAFREAATVTGKKGAEGITQYDKILLRFQGELRKLINTEMDNVGVVAGDGSGRSYSQVMSDFGARMGQLDRWKFWLGTELGDEEGIKHASQFLRNLHKTENLGFRQAAEEFQASTGINVLARAERAMVSELFGEAGKAKTFPRIAAVGEPVGTGLGRRALQFGTLGIGGAALGGLPGAAGAMMIGGTMASEAGQLAIARSVPRLARATGAKVLNVADMLERSTNAKTLTTIQSISRALRRDEEPEQFPLQRATKNKEIRNAP